MAYPPNNWCRIPAKELQLGDRVVPDPAPARTRAYAIDRIERKPGARPIEVAYRGAGTWHYKLDDKVTVVRDPAKCSTGGG